MPTSATKSIPRVRHRTRPWLRWLARFIFATLWLIVLLLGAELALRLGQWHSQRDSEDLRAFQQAVSSEETLWAIPYFEYKPSSHTELKLAGRVVYSVEINRHGLRGPDFELPKPEGEFRIVCIGGSTTFEGVSNDLTYPATLERLLQKRLNTNRIRVINAGISGLTTEGELQKLPFVLSLQPDLVIHYNAVNDICFQLMPDYLQRELGRWQNIIRKSALLTLTLRPLFTPAKEDILRQLELVRVRNRDIFRRAAAANVEVVFATFAHPKKADMSWRERAFFEYNMNLRNLWNTPLSFETYVQYVDEYNRLLTEWCTDNRVAMVPVADRLVGGRDIFSDICHCTTQGIQRKADIIAAAISEDVAARLDSSQEQTYTRLVEHRSLRQTDEHARKVVIPLGNRPIAKYVLAEGRIPHPYFADVLTPQGTGVTRNYPPRLGIDSLDHPDVHPGIWIGFSELGGTDFWNLHGRVAIEQVEEFHAEGNGMAFAVRHHYINVRGDQTICKELCRYRFQAHSLGFLMTTESTFTSSERDFAFGDQKEMGFAVRVATSLAVANGGEVIDSEGNRDEDGGRGHQADWCDYSGVVDGKRVGVLLMPSPDNFRKCWFDVRDDGLMVANPFGRQALSGGEPGSVVVKRNEPFRLGFAALIYEQSTSKPIDCETIYRACLASIRRTTQEP